MMRRFSNAYVSHFWNKDVEWVSIAHEKSDCKKLLMRPSYSQEKTKLFSGV